MEKVGSLGLSIQIKNLDRVLELLEQLEKIIKEIGETELEIKTKLERE